MKTDRGTEEHTDRAPYRYASDKADKNSNFEDKFFTVVSLGTIVSGGLACLVSVGIGISLVILGSMVLAEL